MRATKIETPATLDWSECLLNNLPILHSKMPNCQANTAAGSPCGKNASYHVGELHLCGTHHNQRMRTDDSYRHLYEQMIEQDRVRREAALAARANVIQAEAARREAERVAAQAARDRVIQAKQAKNDRIIAEAPSSSSSAVTLIAKNLMNLWIQNTIQGYSIPKAYACLRYKPIYENAGFPTLIRAAVKIVRQGFGNHPTHERYGDVPLPERTLALDELEAALAPYTPAGYLAWIPQSDTLRPTITLRMRREEEERLRAEEAARQAARDAQLQLDLRQRPVVFQRDPEGGINLAAFANDAQSVHRSSVQNATHRAVLALLNRPLVAGQDTLPEILTGFGGVRWIGEGAHERTVMELTNDYFNTEAFSVMYGEVLDHVWAYIREHAHRTDLTLRLAQEAAEGIGMCSNGKMARLVNVLQGYDETLEAEKPKELFQHAIAALMSQPLVQRESAARRLFAEYNIPEAEHAVWLEPLLEA